MQSLLFLEDVPPACWLGNWCLGAVMSRVQKTKNTEKTNPILVFFILFTSPQSLFLAVPNFGQFCDLTKPYPYVFIQHVLRCYDAWL